MSQAYEGESDRVSEGDRDPQVTEIVVESTELALPDGSSVVETTAVATSTGPVSTPTIAPGARFCQSCGTSLVATAMICPSCGTAQGTPKSKSTAVLLAVFLSFWTWVYTYKRDAAKFWIGLGLNVVLGTLLWFVLFGWLVWLGVWIWAIVDVAVRQDSFYRNYPNG